MGFRVIMLYAVVFGKGWVVFVSVLGERSALSIWNVSKVFFINVKRKLLYQHHSMIPCEIAAE